MTSGEPLPKKVRLSETDFEVMARDELILRWKQYEAYVQALEDKYADLNSNITGLREAEAKLKQQQQVSTHRKNILVMRLATKEEELKEYTAQIQCLQQGPGAARVASRMADPAINFLFLKMKEELEKSKHNLEETQNELSAWKFAPASQLGEDLMAKCRRLIRENHQLGRHVNPKLIMQLEAELALQKKYRQELQSSQSEMNHFIVQLEEEVQDMQSTILLLQQQLKETHQQLAQYQAPAPAPSTSTITSEPAGQTCSVVMYTQLLTLKTQKGH